MRPFPETLFGKLPPEIRGPIYHALLAFPSPFTHPKSTPAIVSSNQNKDTQFLPKSSLNRSKSPTFIDLKNSSLGVLQTCRAIFCEAHPIFYGGDSYYFSDPTALLAFLRTIGAKGRQKIRALRLAGLGKIELGGTPEQLSNAKKNMPDSFYRMFSGTCWYDMKFDTFEAFEIMTQCNGLRKIHLDMNRGQEAVHLRLVSVFASKQLRSVQLFRDFDHWVVGSVFPTIYNTEDDIDDFRTMQQCMKQRIYASGERYLYRRLNGGDEDLNSDAMQIVVDIMP